MPDLDLLKRIERNLRFSAAFEREVVDLGAFEAFFADRADPMLNVALPARPASDWPAAVVDMDACFAARGRRPRVELFVERYPRLPAALEAAGYRRDVAAPVMALRPGELRPRSGPEGYEIFRLRAGDEASVDAFLAAQAEAFGMLEDLSENGWRPALLAGLDTDTIMVAVAMAGSQVVSGASLLLGAGSAELAGVGTRPDFRRQGISSAVCAALLADYFEAGHALCWLSAGPGADGLYKGLGFSRVGTQLHYSRPD